MSTNPSFDYTQLIINGFRKAFPFLHCADPEKLAKWLYYTVSAFSGRDGRSLAGGGEDDIRCLIAAAAAVELEVCSARKIKNNLRMKLRQAWLKNDHALILSCARGFERNASMNIINLHNIEWIDPSRVIDEAEEEQVIVISETIEEWIETLTEPSEARSIIGNRSSKRLRRKQAERAVKSLFEGV